jgi:hypothetical protein
VTGWVAAFDESFKRVPVSRMQDAYDAGQRVLGPYAGGGSAGKQVGRSEIDAWMSRRGTGVAALFEIFGTEPIDNPSSGASHAKSARSAWRALGYPDHAAIFVAVDENVTIAEARAQLTAYFRAWAGVDTVKPVPYVEADAGLILFDEGLTLGTFTPAAYAWNDPPVLYSPSNAPSHVLWTQEHNGQGLYGGDLDIGHIRSTAPIWWADGRLGDVGVVSMDEQSIAAAVWAYKQPGGVAESLGGCLSDLRAASAGGSPTAILAAINAVAAKVGVVLDDETSEAAAIAALSTKLDGVPAAVAAAVVAGLPDPTGVVQGLTADQISTLVEQATQAALGHLGLVVTP